VKVWLGSLGCRLNQAEIEAMAAELRARGLGLAQLPEEAGIAIINTCSVTAAAAADSRGLVRRTHRRNPAAEIILTGCWSTLEPARAAALPGVVRVVANDTKDALVAEVFCAARQGEAPSRYPREPIPGDRHRLRAFLKIQDGCDQHCTYCVARLARGHSHSLPESAVLDHAREALAGGAQEIVLTGVALSAYGSDRGAHGGLAQLIRRLLAETAVPRLRLSSLEPWAVSPALLDALDHPAVCRHLHLPLQSGARKTLHRMGRPSLPRAYAGSVAQARARLPGVRITTDLLVGFPGETEAEFGESLAFIEELGFADAHIFRYSPRPGTPAAGFAESVPPHLARQRAEHVRQVVARSRHADEASRQGQEEEVLWIRATAADSGLAGFQGLARCGIRVQTTSARNLINTRTAVRLGGPTAGGLCGFVLPTGLSDRRGSAGAECGD